ncbi:MAG: N-acetylmuramoyl-L-alanine amidase [Bdellovibrionota bacterium]
MRILPGSSPNFATNEIEPQFVILHYTACNLQRALAIFSDRERKVCAHFVLDLNGDLYDLGNFWQGPILQGAHAGVSHYKLGAETIERLNTCSVGIEIVNLNGNLLPYTEAQYTSLTEILLHLGKRFPVLADPERIIGHEDIAGFRGKVDPGLLFDWNRLFQSLFDSARIPQRVNVMNPADAAALRKRLSLVPEKERTDDFWSEFSASLEAQFGRKS